MINYRSQIGAELRISAGLLGATHKFSVDGRDFEVCLPQNSTSDHMSGGIDRYGRSVAIDVANSEERRGETFTINFIDIQTPVEFAKGGYYKNKLDGKSFAEIGNIIQGNSKGDIFDDSLSVIPSLTREAFQFWLRSVWWCTGNSTLGSSGSWIDNASGHGDLVFESNGEIVLRGRNNTTVVTLRKPISSLVWKEIQDVLSGPPPPIWSDFFYQAERRVREGDLAAALLEAVASAEAYIRGLLEVYFRDFIRESPAVGPRISQWQINDILKNREKILPLKSASFTPDEVKALERAFERRNRIIHGREHNVDKAIVKEILNVMSHRVRARKRL